MTDGLLEEEAVVDALDGDFVWVRTTRTSACGGCSARGGCGSGILAEVLGRRAPRVRALNRAGAGLGDRVLVAVTPGAFLRSSLAMYLVPLLGLLGGGMAGTLIAGNVGMPDADGWAIAGGIAGAVLAMVWVRAFARRVADDPRYQPVAVRRVTAAVEVPLNLAVGSASLPGFTKRASEDTTREY